MLLRLVVTDHYHRDDFTGFDFHREFRFVGYDDEDNELYSTTETEWVLRKGGPQGHPMRVLSGSESAQLLIEFDAALARERSATTPTVLLLDGSEWPFDQPGMDAIGLLLAWAYSAPPLALMCRGLGELTVSLSWGLMVLGEIGRAHV